jgi:hypothetical protein
LSNADAEALETRAVTAATSRSWTALSWIWMGVGAAFVGRVLFGRVLVGAVAAILTTMLIAHWTPKDSSARQASAAIEPANKAGGDPF